MADQAQEKSSASEEGPIKIDMATASPPPHARRNVGAVANPEEKKPDLPLGLGLKDAKGTAELRKPEQEPEAVKAEPEAPEKPDYIRAQPSENLASSADLEALSSEYKTLKSQHDSLRSSIEEGRTARRLQELRTAGVQVLTDSELLTLAPKVDPDTYEGKRAIDQWLQEHQELVSPRFRTRPSPAPSIIEKHQDNPGLMAVFGNSATLQSKIKQYFEE
jgi:hypothetical protein